MTEGNFCDWSKLLGRAMMAVMFVLAGWGKIGGYGDTQAYMESAGVPGALLPLVILVELGGGLAVLLGFFTRWAALLLALFTLATAAMFHYVPDDQMQMINFMKNVSIAGGFIILACVGGGRLSLDHIFRRKNK